MPQQLPLINMLIISFVREDAAAILSHFSAASAGKEAPGEPPGAAGAGEARMGSRRSPRTQKIPQKKNFPERRVGT